MLISFFYNLIIEPIVIVYELVYGITEHYIFYTPITEEIIVCILVVSIVFNLLTYPLYKKADELQTEARLKKDKMSKWVDHIKKNFKGDERYFILSTYYKENNYSPFDQIKESLSLLIQIPFFAAAYIFFTSMNYTNKTAFNIISLGAEDALLNIGDMSINILPIIMTIINLISASVYTKGVELKDKLSSYILPVLFLIILYRSPSALVLYWTFNNILSLIKIIIIKLTSRKAKSKKQIHDIEEEKILDNSFKWVNVACFLFIGIIIPSLVLSVSINEFNTRFYTINDFLTYGIVIFAGFALWTAVLYYFNDNKKAFVVGIISICIFMILNHIMYMNNNGYITNEFQYDSWDFNYEIKDFIINILYFLIIIIVISILSKKVKIINYISKILCITFTVWGVYLVGRIESNYITYLRSERERSKVIIKEDSSKPFINLSNDGENIIFICLDRFIARYYPYALKLRPDLKEKFDGFDIYLNTLSFGPQTDSGAPAMFGGYEYTAFEMNKIDDTLSNKTSKAATVIPKILSNEGYNVELIDSHFETEKISIDNVKNISFRENVNTDYIENNSNNFLINIKNKFVRYSIMKVSPLFLKDILYDGGDYGLVNKSFYDFDIISNYAVLDKLKDVTNIVNDNGKNAFIMHNELTHTPRNIKYPNFDLFNNEGEELKDINIVVDGVKFEGNVNHLSSTVTALIKIGEYLDYLRANDVYDNTRIIIVADHGFAYFNNFDHYRGKRDKLVIDEKRIKENYVDEAYVAAYPQQYNPILMYKDFNEKGYKEKKDFMTNADAAYLTIKDISKDMKNPWTGNEISMDYKNKKLNLFTFVSMQENDEVYNKDKRMFNRYGYGLIFEGNEVYGEGALEFDYNVENLYCIDNNVHKLVLHKKNDDEKTCGDKFIIDIYECEICHKCFKDINQNEYISNLNDYILNIPHKFINYISDNNDSLTNHGTKTAECDYGCGTKDTIYDENINMHHHFVNVIKKANMTNDGYMGRECDKCHILEPNKDVEIIPALEELKLESEYVEMTGNKNNARVVGIDKEGNEISDDNIEAKYFNNDNLGNAYAIVTLKNHYEIINDDSIRFDYKIVPERVKIKSVEHKRSNLIVSIELGKGRINDVEIVVDDKEDKLFTFKKTEKNEYKVNLTDFNNEAKKIKVRVVRYDNATGEALYSPWVEGEVK